ncbi:serine protease [Leptospira perolatii]|uniref:Serine protease n=1 Tax=Leptospira perolatii TaxID=2023191 RepID=A0A2M9ZP25_9LEPT|nr:PDZ domain-containing protein [Leptospira perolatii]PJZ70626.1 serine protease [Leptospira perolatii]PJZ73838.1 serine protease [Leptospira perolatii]
MKFRILPIFVLILISGGLHAKQKKKQNHHSTESYLSSNIQIPSKAEENYKKSIVQIKISYQEPDYLYPWKRKSPKVRRAVGIVVEGGRILLPAHLLLYHTLIEVKKFSSYTETKANLLRLDPEINLALLKIEDKDFFQDLKPLEFHSIVMYPKQVSIFQLDNSGSIQTAAGNLLSLDLDQSPIGHVELPILDVNSTETLNGNGEVLLENGKVSGILFDFTGDKNSGRAIPSFLIQKFLGILGNAKVAYKGFRYRPITDQATKNFYGVPGQNQGILVGDVLPNGSADGVLKPGDVILEFGGKKIDSKGYFDHPHYGKQALSFLSNFGDSFGYSIGKSVPLLVVRDKKETKLEMILKTFPYSSVRIPHRSPQAKSEYYLDGGFLFLELSEDYLQEWGKDWRSRVDKKLLYFFDYRKFRTQKDPEGRIVLFSQVFPDESNEGYHEVSSRIVESVNSSPVNSVRDLAQKVKESKSKYVTILLDDGTEVVIDKSELKSANERIQNQYKIPVSAMGEQSQK